MRICTVLLLLAALLLHPSDAVQGVQRIKRVVVLMEENRSFDHLLGWSKLPVNKLNGKEFNLVDTKDPRSQKIFVTKDAQRVSDCDPDHGTPGTTQKIFGLKQQNANNFTVAGMVGFVERANQLNRSATKPAFCGVLAGQDPKNVPVFEFLAREYAIADRFFASHPGPTWPNRLFFLTGTSGGLTETGNWFQNVTGKLFPMRSIFEQLDSEGLSWKNYYNDTPWELLLEGLAHQPERIAPLESFFEDARTGNLPAFSWINPRAGVNISTGFGSNDMHPDHDVALAEEYYKTIYEAVRASPQWNETLLVITFDEHGGFYDHVPTPLGAPAPDDIPSYPDPGFKWNRLGVRIPTLFISPWIARGTVLSAPPASQKPAPNSEYELTSVISTTRKLLGMKSGPLTKRDAWSATFEHLIEQSSSPRTDCPMHTPPAPAPTTNHAAIEAELPVNGLQLDIIAMHARATGCEMPNLAKQGEVSLWLQEQFRRHCEMTSAWKASKVATKEGAGRFQVKFMVSNLPQVLLISWELRKSNHSNYWTISTMDAPKDLHNYCLEVPQDAKAGSVVGIAPCYPTADPDVNRDIDQHWVWNDDNSISLARNPSLCVTSHKLDHDHHGDLDAATLQACKPSAQQRFAYYGAAPGNQETGEIQYGVFDLVVV